jgi:hypothetical protein
MAKLIKVWDGTAWQDVAPSLPYTAIHSAQASMPLTGVDGQVWLDTDGTLAGQDFVPLSGGTMTGNLNVPSINSGPIVGRNKVLNGDFSIWQRGTTATNGFLADRWYFNGGAATSFSQTRQAFTPGSAPISGYEGKYFWRNTITNVGSETAWYLNTYIEDVQTLAGQTATFSFFAKSDSPRALSAYLLQRFGDSGSTNVSTTIGTASVTTSWQRFTFTISIPSISGKTIGANNLIQIFFAMTPASGMVLDLWGIQLEAGNQATPFHTATPNQQTELAACQRYYYRLGGDQTYQLLSYGPAHSTTRAYIPIRFPVTMRTIPSSIDWSTLALQRDPSQSIYSVTSLANLNNNGSGRDVFGLDVTIGSASLSAGTPYILMTNGSTSAYLGFSAEL